MAADPTVNRMRPLHRTVEHVDTDAAGVMHFSRYASLMETAVLRNLEDLGIGPRALGDLGLDVAVTQVRIDYAAPARYPDPIRIRVGIEHVGLIALRIGAEAERVPEPGTGALADKLASGTLVMCLLDRASRGPVRLPDAVRQKLRGCSGGERGRT